MIINMIMIVMFFFWNVLLQFVYMKNYYNNYY